MPTVVITGASGFIAQNITQLLLLNKYKVIGTVRSDQKGAALAKLISHQDFSYKVVPDLGVPGSVDHVLTSNVDYFMHTAMPFFTESTDPEGDLIKPAVDGTTSILNSILKLPYKIKKFILTSLDAAVYCAEDEQNSLLSFNESSWNNAIVKDDPYGAYYTGKALSEKLVWLFIEKNKGVFEFVSINPVYVFGPQAYPVDRPLNVSNQVVLDMLKLSEFDNDKAGFIDVRDVARAHLFALENEKAVGKRLLMSNGHFSFQQIADIINARYPGKAPKGTPGTGPTDILTLAKVDNTATRKLLDFEFISLEKSVLDTVGQYLQQKKSSNI